jgi:hypothetical protein
MKRRAFAVLILAAAPAAAQESGPAINLKIGQSATLPATIADGVVRLGLPRIEKGAEPKDGEIVVSVARNGLSPYADVIVSEKTAQPVDFVATGLIGDIKIDEIKICGRLDAPVRTRIASGSWRVALKSFAVLPDGQTCRP